MSVAETIALAVLLVADAVVVALDVALAARFT